MSFEHVPASKHCWKPFVRMRGRAAECRAIVSAASRRTYPKIEPTIHVKP